VLGEGEGDVQFDFVYIYFGIDLEDIGDE
jgi:hypothetical protein